MSASRRGSAYLLVLGASMLIVTVGVSAVMISKQRTAAAILRSEAMRARAGALAGMSMALELADDDVMWRSAHVDAPKCFVSSLDGVSIRVLASDPSDGVLDDDWTDPVLLRSVANIGGGARTYEASFKPVIRRVESASFAFVPKMCARQHGSVRMQRKVLILERSRFARTKLLNRQVSTRSPCFVIKRSKSHHVIFTMPCYLMV